MLICVFMRVSVHVSTRVSGHVVTCAFVHVGTRECQYAPWRVRMRVGVSVAIIALVERK